MSLYRDRNLNDAISTGKLPENTQLHLVSLPGLFPVEMTFMFMSQQRHSSNFLFVKYIYIKNIHNVCIEIMKSNQS